MAVLFALAAAIRQEKSKVVSGVRPQPFDEAGARPERTRRASRLRTESLDLGTKTAGRTTIPNLITL